MRYQFTSDCMTGIKEIDDEHRQLFESVNEVFDELEKEGDESQKIMKLLVAELKDYAAEHFAHEEAYMEKTGDPELESQRSEHRYFTEKVNAISFDDLTPENAKKQLPELMEFIAHWLYHHILSSDVLIGKSAANSDQAGAENIS